MPVFNGRTRMEEKSVAGGGNTIVSHATLSNGLQAFWEFDSPPWNGVPGEVIDSTGNGHDGTGNNFPSAGASAIFGDSIYTDATSIPPANVSLLGTTRSSLNISEVPGEPEFSIMLWARPESIGAYQGITGESAVGLGHTCYFGTNGGTPQDRWMFYSVLDGVSPIVVSATPFVPNIWHHIAATLKIGESMKIYVNGVLDKTFAITGTTNFANLSPSATWLISSNSIQSIFNGSLDDMGIWNRELTPAEISDHYNSGTGLPYN